MKCPDCDGRMVKIGVQYGNTVYQCSECMWTEEIPDRTIQKKPKLKVWGKGETK